MNPPINTNTSTGIPFGYISAQALNPEVVMDLTLGPQATDLTWDEFEDHHRGRINIEAAERGFEHGSRDWENFCERELEKVLDDYSPVEPCIAGVLDGVSYRTSWLGGALNFWIFDSPVTTDKARRASPCVPGAAILDTLDGSEFGYDVPADWRAEA